MEAIKTWKKHFLNHNIISLMFMIMNNSRFPDQIIKFFANFGYDDVW